MIDQCRDLALSLETFDGIVGGQQVPREKFQSDGLAGGRMFGFIDRTHSPLTKLANDAERPNQCAG